MNDVHCINVEDLSILLAEIIPILDNNPSREGLRATPDRYAKFFKQFLEKKPFNVTVFDSEGYDGMITQRNIPFYSLCEHHMVPFFGYATISYIPGKKIVGLSKLSRILNHFSHNLQNQERITKQVADFIENTVQPKGVAVSLTARHLCMEMRGVEKHNAPTTTTYVTGVFKTNLATRSEFLAQTK